VGLHEVFADPVDQFIEIPVVLRADREGITESEAGKIVGEVFVLGGIDLVDEEDGRRAALAQHGSELLIDWSEPVLGVDHEEDQRGGLNRNIGFETNLGGESVVETSSDAAGVDQFKGAPAARADCGDAIPGDSGFVVDDGDAASDETVEDGGLADIGAPDDRHRGTLIGKYGFGHENRGG